MTDSAGLVAVSHVLNLAEELQSPVHGSDHIVKATIIWGVKPLWEWAMTSSFLQTILIRFYFYLKSINCNWIFYLRVFEIPSVRALLWPASSQAFLTLESNQLPNSSTGTWTIMLLNCCHFQLINWTNGTIQLQLIKVEWLKHGNGDTAVEMCPSEVVYWFISLVVNCLGCPSPRRIHWHRPKWCRPGPRTQEVALAHQLRLGDVINVTVTRTERRRLRRWKSMRIPTAPLLVASIAAAITVVIVIVVHHSHSGLEPETSAQRE